MKRFCLFFVLAVVNIRALEIIDASADPLIAVGERLELTCDIEGEYDFCEWTYSDAWQCMTYKGSLGEEMTCDDQERATVIGTEGSCTLGLEDITLDDQGEFTCMVGIIEDSDLVKVDHLFTVAVAVPGNVEFGGDITEADDMWMILQDEEVTFSCHGNGGTPAAEVLGFLGSDEAINEDEDDALDEASLEELENPDDERLIDITKEFTFTPSRDDCGKYLKCSAKQFNDDGELVFEDVPEISKKIMVVFPPQPNDEEHAAGFNEETGEPVDIEIRFESHPAPSDDQVTWYLGDDTILAGEELDDKFTAHPLEMGDDDWVIARLTVNYMSAEDADLTYQLSAENAFSDEAVFYDFALEFNAKPLPTTTTTTTTTTTIETTTYNFVRLFAEPDVQAQGIGGSSIAAIVIIIIVIIVSGICIVWLKREERLCFAAYEEVNQKPDAENGNGVKSTPIVKD